MSWRIGKDSWVWTGYLLEDLNPAQRRALDFTDVLIDGPFIEELKGDCVWRGSLNQRIWKKDENNRWDRVNL